MADVVLAGDVWYERELAAQVSAFLDRMAAAGALTLTGQQQRGSGEPDRSPAHGQARQRVRGQAPAGQDLP